MLVAENSCIQSMGDRHVYIINLKQKKRKDSRLVMPYKSQNDKANVPNGRPYPPNYK